MLRGMQGTAKVLAGTKFAEIGIARAFAHRLPVSAKKLPIS